MKKYEKKICNVMNNARDELMLQIRNAYDEGYEDGLKDGYEDGKADTPFTDTEEAEKKAYDRGLSDAWDVAKKIYDMDGGDLVEVFNDYDPYKVTQKYTATEALAKIKAYEDKQKQDAEIKVGDEIVYSDGIKGVVVGISNTVGQISVLNNKYDAPQLLVKNRAKKTGRTFSQIAEVLKELRGAENDK